MERRRLPTLILLTTIGVGAIIALPTTPAWADEDDDLQREIDTQKSGLPDLEHLDTRHAASVELQHLHDWLSLPWDLRNKPEPDGARRVRDRCLAQAELVRQVIASSQMK